MGAPAVSPGQRRRIPLREVTLPHVCPRPVRMYVLARSPYFSDLGDDDLGRIDERMQATSWREGDSLYRAGEPAGHLYIVAEGRVKLSQVTPSGVETVADVLAPGELFGAMGTLGEPFHLQSASAMVGSCALRIDQESFRAVLREHPTVALRVLDDVAARLTRAHTDIGGQSTDTVAQRVATALLRLADKLGEDRGADGILIEVPLARTDLAGLARSTPESVSRVMSRWRREGVIDSGRRWTAIKDRDRLEAMKGAA
ncbi:Crp/Fnr family transcriptional regulator [Microbacterium sp. Mu-80]|uniref:Crp/Fnr family transcriptional regulator n=1 Tax=Microbacterium bandirmense TaxID=3122050 RepID=A0ABU8LD13_9MICO